MIIKNKNVSRPCMDSVVTFEDNDRLGLIQPQHYYYPIIILKRRINHLYENPNLERQSLLMSVLRFRISPCLATLSLF